MLNNCKSSPVRKKCFFHKLTNYERERLFNILHKKAIINGHSFGAMTFGLTSRLYFVGRTFDMESRSRSNLCRRRQCQCMLKICLWRCTSFASFHKIINGYSFDTKTYGCQCLSNWHTLTDLCSSKMEVHVRGPHGRVPTGRQVAKI